MSRDGDNERRSSDAALPEQVGRESGEKTGDGIEVFEGRDRKIK